MALKNKNLAWLVACAITVSITTYLLLSNCLVGDVIHKRVELKQVYNSYVKGEVVGYVQGSKYFSTSFPILTQSNKLLICEDVSLQKVIDEYEIPGEVISHAVGKTFLNSKSKTNELEPDAYFIILLICKTDRGNVFLCYSLLDSIKSDDDFRNSTNRLYKVFETPTEASKIVFIFDEPTITYVCQNSELNRLYKYNRKGELIHSLDLGKPILFSPPIETLKEIIYNYSVGYDGSNILFYDFKVENPSFDPVETYHLQHRGNPKKAIFQKAKCYYVNRGYDDYTRLIIDDGYVYQVDVLKNTIVNQIFLEGARMSAEYTYVPFKDGLFVAGILGANATNPDGYSKTKSLKDVQLETIGSATLKSAVTPVSFFSSCDNGKYGLVAFIDSNTNDEHMKFLRVGFYPLNEKIISMTHDAICKNGKLELKLYFFSEKNVYEADGKLIGNMQSHLNIYGN